VKAHAKKRHSRIDGKTLMARLDTLAGYTETPGQITRTYLTPAQKTAGEALIGWMRSAGMAAAFDAVGNVVGRLAGQNPDAPAILVGSHYDTVVNAGKYDGPYGILAGLAAVEALQKRGRRIARPVELVAFAEEEGVRFKSTLIGSRALAGTLDPQILDLVDTTGERLGDALARFHGTAKAPSLKSAARRPDSTAAYLELHIEQGPVLLQEKLPVGVVTGIAGASRFMIGIDGQAGHAGTVPMDLRRDALTAAAELILAVERICRSDSGLVGTVGMASTPGGATNVVPGRVELSLDVRAGADKVRRAALAQIRLAIDEIVKRRKVRISLRKTHDAAAVSCDRALQSVFAEAIEARGMSVRRLPSGAGHDAMAMAGLCPVAMLFVRCGNGGISHDPRETMTSADAAFGAEILCDVLDRLVD
jgi:hydantoinase/carbamoylase family amidase